VTRLVLMRGEEPTPEALMRGGQAAVEVREIALTLAREPGFAARDVITPKRTGVGITFEAVSVRPCAIACTLGGLLGSREPAGSSSSIWPKERQDVCSPQSSAYDVYLPRWWRCAVWQDAIDNAARIKSLLRGSPADQSGLLKPGDVCARPS
jgi:hypothetical protein